MLLAELAESQRIDGAFEMEVQFGLGKATDEISIVHWIILCKNSRLAARSFRLRPTPLYFPLKI